LAVPLDYDEPDGRMIELSVIKLPATDAESRVGSLVINPGGPGGSGVEYARSARQVITKEVRARFDIVGFDPRGVGESTPVECLDGSEIDALRASEAVPTDASSLHAIEAESKNFAARCQARSGDLLPHVGTRDAARDMDVLRAALGDEKLTYLGKSYGTYLGAIYAELFPTRVRALVLDGALDPTLSSEDLDRAQARGFEVALQSFIADCVKRSGCPLGTSSSAATSRLERFLADVDRSPLPGDGARELTGGDAISGVAAALYSKEQGWPILRIALRAALGGDGAALLSLADAMSERNSDGEYSNLLAANTAINCADHPSPKDASAYQANAEIFAKESPVFGAFMAWSGLVCAYWPFPATIAPEPIHAVGAAPILVIGTTRDPATPYAWAQALASQLDSGVLLTYEGDGHTAYGNGNACIDRAVEAYLIDSKSPAADTRCK
jgi:pimeloyl-ACP methyl ester carboxylesterase